MSLKMKILNHIYPSIKGKRLSSESKKKGNFSVQQPNATPTPEAILYVSNFNYAKNKEYKKFTALKSKIIVLELTTRRIKLCSRIIKHQFWFFNQIL